MTKIIIEIENGVLSNVISNDNVQYKLIDWDNVKQGDKIDNSFYEPDMVVDENEFNEILNENIEIANKFYKTINGEE